MGTLLHRRPAMVLAVTAIVLAFAIAHASTPVRAATSSTVVGATVPSATSLSIAGCPPGTAGATWLGTVLPGSTAIGSASCSVSFGSSNDTSMLRMSQLDGAGAGMHSLATQLDSGFGTAGTTDFDVDPANDDEPTAVVREPGTGKPIVFGTIKDPAGWDIYMARFLSNGTLDGSFGGGSGIVTIDLGAFEAVNSARVDPDGSGYLLTGARGPADINTDLMVLRVDSVGAPETSFNGTGYRTIHSSTWEWISGVTHRRDGDGWYASIGHVVAGGYFRDRIARLNEDFTLDTTFGGDGFADLPSAMGDSCGSLVELSDGRLVCAGDQQVTATRSDAIVARFLANGSLDTTLAGDGIAEYPMGVLDAQDKWNGLVPLAGGGYLLLGQVDGPGALTASIGRLDASLAFDTTFTGDGWQAVPVAGADASTFHVGEPYPDGNGYIVLGTSIHLATASLRPVIGHVSADGTWSQDGFGPVGFINPDMIDDPNTLELPTSFDGGTDGALLIASRSQQGDYVSHISRFASSTIPDYQFGASDWTNGTGAFGACLFGVTNATADWGVGACTGANAATWVAVPAAASKVAHAASGQASASAQFRFGLRVPSNQPPGTYVSRIAFEVIAPNA